MERFPPRQLGVTYTPSAEAEQRLGAAKFLRRPTGSVLLFVIGYALVDLLPVVLPANPRLFGLGLNAFLDAALVFVLVALYVRLGMDAELWRTPALRAANAIALVMLVQGHAVHLAANAIAEAGSSSGRAGDLTFFLDEHWGHTELHLAFVLLAALFIAYGRSGGGEAADRSLSRTERVVLYIATLVYGLFLAADAIEGQTVLLMLPAGVGLFLWAFLPRLRFALKPTPGTRISVYSYFFAASFGLAAVALVAYGSVMHGFPQFSEL